MSKVPEFVLIYVCEKCGRKGFSSLDVRPGHWSHGEKCGGAVRVIRYERGEVIS